MRQYEQTATDQLSQGWWQQHPHQNYPWLLRLPTVIKEKNSHTIQRVTDKLLGNCKACIAKGFLQLIVPKPLGSLAVASTCSKEVGCMGAGLWVKEEAGRQPVEVESSFPPELPGLSVLSSTCASGERKDFWFMYASLPPKRKEKQMSEVHFRQDHTLHTMWNKSTTSNLSGTVHW